MASTTGKGTATSSTAAAAATATAADVCENPSALEFSHYVVTAHPPGCVLSTARCNFLAPDSVDVLIAKSGRLEVRQLRRTATATTMTASGTAERGNNGNDGAVDLTNPFPQQFQVPMYGRVTYLVPFSMYHSPTALVFFLTDRHQYGVLGYDHYSNSNANHYHNLYPIVTHASGSVTAASLWSQGNSAAGTGSAAAGGGGGLSAPDHLHHHGSAGTAGGGGSAWANENTLAVLGQEAPSGPLVVVDPLGRCIVMHLHSGLLAIIPIHRQYNPVTATATATAGQTQYKMGGAGGDTTPPSRKSAPATYSSCLGQLFHCRVEERLILNMAFLEFPNNNIYGGNSNNEVLPHICILHQDARGAQHVSTHVLQITKRQLHFCQSTTVPAGTTVEWLRKSAVDGGSSLLLPVPPLVAPSPVAAAAAASANAFLTSTNNTNNSSSSSSCLQLSGGVIVLGQRQFTYLSSTATKIIPVPQALYLSYATLPPDPSHGMPRFLLGDEFGNLHMLTLLLTNPAATAATSSASSTSSQSLVVLGLQLETLGSCNLSRDLCYLDHGLAYVASHLGDSQLIQIHDEPIPVNEGVAASTAGRGGSHGGGGGGVFEDSSLSPNMVADALIDTTYIQVLEEYTNLGPILDFDLIPAAPSSTTTTASSSVVGLDSGGGGGVSGEVGKSTAATATAMTTTNQIQQSQVVTCSGSSKMGSLRVIRNGIGMNEYASVEIPGISNMWSLRKAFQDLNDTYLVQSFVGQTRVLGVTMATDGDQAMAEGGQEERDDEDEEPFGSLEEVVLPGLESNATTLYVGNLAGDSILQITEAEIRLIGSLATGGQALDIWSNGPITVAAANEAGQMALAQRGGIVLYFQVEDGKSIRKVADSQMEREVSCLNLNPFQKQGSASAYDMDVDNSSNAKADPWPSRWLAVGLWDDFTVRLLDLSSPNLKQAQKIHLSFQAEVEEEEEDSDVITVRRNRNNMMARSLCLITLDFSSSSGNSNANHAPATANPGVDMLFVGLGDGSLISFAVVERDGHVSVRSKKEVCLGTQPISLVPLTTRGRGTCVLATGDRPTVIYLAGIAGAAASSNAQFNPKLCYSGVNVSPSEDEELDDNTTRPPSHQNIVVNVASPFYSPLLLDPATGTGSGNTTSSQQYSLCIADETSLRLGVIDDIQKLHVTTCRLGMAPRRIVHCLDGRLFAVGCMESGIQLVGAPEPTHSMGNCIRFMDDTSFDDIKRIDLDPFETIVAMAYVSLRVPGGGDRASMEIDTTTVYKPFLVVGTGYAIPDESEMTRGRILLYSCQADESIASNARTVRQVTELSANGGVFSICQFYEGTMLCTVNSKTMLCRLLDDAGLIKLEFVGVGHHGHILSMFVKSRAKPQTSLPDSPGVGAPRMPIGGSGARQGSKKGSDGSEEEMLAIVGDLMRSVSVIQYFPDHQILDEIARDFNASWTTAVEMLTDDIYLAAEHWNNLYCLRRNKTASSEEIRGRLDIVGEYHFGEMCNKFMSGSLVMPVSASSTKQQGRRMGNTAKKDGESPAKKAAVNARVRRPVVITGSQTLFGTVDGSLGSILGMDNRTAAFFSTLERAMAKTIRPIGDLSHQFFRAYQGERRMHPAHGFVDGDLVESFLDLDRGTMEAVVREMNRDGGWEMDDAIALRSPEDTEDMSLELTVEDVVSMVEEISMLH